MYLLLITVFILVAYFKLYLLFHKHLVDAAVGCHQVDARLRHRDAAAVAGVNRLSVGVEHNHLALGALYHDIAPVSKHLHILALHVVHARDYTITSHVVGMRFLSAEQIKNTFSYLIGDIVPAPLSLIGYVGISGRN